MTDFWCEQALVGDPDDGTIEPGVLVEATGATITGVRRGGTAPPGAIRLAGLVSPGLVDAHSHAFHRALRATSEGADGNFWSWRDEMYRLADRIDPAGYKQLCEALFVEMLLAGITTVGEFHYLHRAPGGAAYGEGNPMEQAIIEAARATGIRLTLIDTCYLHGGIGEKLSGPQLRFGDGTVDSFAERATRLVPDETVRIAMAIHSVRAVLPEEIAAVAEIARDRGAPFHFHLSEQEQENEQCVAAYGVTPTELIERCGGLGQTSVAVHATRCSPRDVELLGRTSTSVCLCPTTERDLGDGVGPAAALRDAGSPLCVGSDSNAVVDLFEEARAVELDERLVERRRGIHRPTSLLAAATSSGAVALGWPEAGRIEVGAACDLVSISLDSTRLAGSSADELVSTVVFSASADDVTDVVVAGRHLVQSGTHDAIDDAGAALRAAIANVRAQA